MQDTIEVHGMVLSSMPVGEADRRVVLLTKELGRISCFAHGARKPTSRMVGATRTFAFGRFELFQGRDAYSLNRAEISEFFEPLFKDPAGTAYGSYFAELAAHFTRENSDEGETAGLLYYSLKALIHPGLQNALVRRIFELKLLQINGFLPDFTVCAKCGKKLESGYFSAALMQALCADCADGRSLYPLGKSTVYTLSFIASSAVGKLFSFSVRDDVLRELSEVSEVLLSHHLDRPPVSRDMLDVLIGPEG